MKLFYKVFFRLALGAVPVLAAWAFFFHYAMMDEVTDEIDDSLEDYSEMIITRSLAGETLPSNDSGSNNQYFLKEVSEGYASSHPAISYRDSMVFIAGKKETEPARILTTFFRDKERRCYKLEVSVPAIERSDLGESILWLIVWLYAALLVAFLLINVVVFKKSMQPLYSLLSWLENNRLGNRKEELAIDTDTQEFRKLNEAVREYSNHSEALFQQQKQFIGNASHEIQTPIAVSINRLEMLMEDESLGEWQLEELYKCVRSLESVSKLNRTLLMLSKIENKQYEDASEVEMNPLVWKYIEDFKEVYAARRMKVSIREEGRCVLRMNAVLAGVLVANLLKNAFVHGADGGEMKIDIGEDGFVVGNTAAGGPLNSSLIFERFWHDEGKSDSTGLGLSLVETICRHSSLVITYRFEEGMHRFAVGK